MALLISSGSTDSCDCLFCNDNGSLKLTSCLRQYTDNPRPPFRVGDEFPSGVFSGICQGDFTDLSLTKGKGYVLMFCSYPLTSQQLVEINSLDLFYDEFLKYNYQPIVIIPRREDLGRCYQDIIDRIDLTPIEIWADFLFFPKILQNTLNHGGHSDRAITYRCSVIIIDPSLVIRHLSETDPRLERRVQDILRSIRDISYESVISTAPIIPTVLSPAVQL